MLDRIEEIIKAAYFQWKSDMREEPQGHINEEQIAAFVENKLPEEETLKIKEHLTLCSICSEAVFLSLKLDNVAEVNPPAQIIDEVRKASAQGRARQLEIVLKIRNGVIDIIDIAGDILVGQEFIPAPLLRSRKVSHFDEEITVLEDFNDILVEAKIENKQGKTFNLAILIKNKENLQVRSDLRVCLIKDDLELESYVTDSGRAVFENIPPSRYRIDIVGQENKLAEFFLDVIS